MTNLEKRYMESKITKNAVLFHLEKMNDYAMGIDPIFGIGNHLTIGKQLLKFGRPQAAAGNWAKVKVKPAQEKPKEPTFEGMELSTPALVAAYEMKILNRLNFIEIKNGGMQILEKYSTPNEAVKNIYSSIKDLLNDKRIIIVVNKENTLFADNDGEIAKTNDTLKKLLDLNNSRLAQEILDTQMGRPLKKIFA